MTGSSSNNSTVSIYGIFPYMDLVFISVITLIVMGSIIGDSNFKTMSFTFPTNRKAYNASNILIMTTIALFSTVSILMISNVKILMPYVTKEEGVVTYFIVNNNLSYTMFMGAKIFIGLMVACLLGYVFTLIHNNYKGKLYTCILVIIGLIGLLILSGSYITVVNNLANSISNIKPAEYFILLIGVITILIFISQKIINREDVR